MSLFDSASLVVTPNGYKATKLYSVIPSDGTGDMAFGRAGNTATRVNASGLIEAVNADIPRLDYTSGGCPKLLLEPQRTNLFTYSQDITNADWNKVNSPTIVSNVAVAPDGTTTADSIQDTTGGNLKYISQNKTITANGSYTLSFFVKKETTRTNFGGVYIILYNGISQNIYVRYNEVDGTIANLTNGTITATLKSESYNNYWRFSISWTDSGGNTGAVVTISPTISTNGTSAGNGAGSARTIWGMQLEAGSYATSYIPTTSAAVTRNADVCLKTSATALIGQTEGTIYGEFFVRNQYVSSLSWIRLASGGLYGSFIFVYANASRVPRVEVIVNNSLVVNLTGTAITEGYHKFALAYKLDDYVLYVDGIQIATDTTSAPVPAMDEIYLDNYIDGGERITSRKSFALWKTRLSNADLAALTSL